MVPVRGFHLVCLILAYTGVIACRGSPTDAARADGGADARPVDASANDATGDGPPSDSHGDAVVGRIDASVDSSAPARTNLALSLPLVPPFSASVHDYYVRCPATSNSITVSMTAAPGSTIAVLRPTPTAPAVDGSATVVVASGGAIVVGVATGSLSDQYWVRCLPSDFAMLDMRRHPTAGAPTPGYYLVGDLFTDAAAQGGYAMMLDQNGVPVWYGKTENGDEAVDVDNLIPGTLSFTPYLDFTFADVAGGEFELHDLVSGTVRHVEPVGAPLDLHELRILPNGDSLVIASPILTGVDLTGLGTLGPSENMIGCIIQELDPTGAVVWDWDATQHFDPVKDSTYPIVKPVGSQLTVNTFHCNSIDIDPDGNLLVGARNMDSIFLISKATGAVLWKLGGSHYTKENAPYIAVSGDPSTSFYRQHDARFLPDGTISMFDDHTDMAGVARGVIYSYDIAAGLATPVWQYRGAQTSTAMGSFRVQPDGSRVIGWGSGAPGLAFTEVDQSGHDLLDFHFQDKRWTYRAIKVPTTAFDIGLLRQSAGTH